MGVDFMACSNCCISCDKNKKACPDYKERSRAVRRSLYKIKKSKQNGGGTNVKST